MARVFVPGGDTEATYWFGDGSDGDLHITEDTEIDVAEDTGHIFLQLRSLIIDAGATLRPSHRCAGMVILVRDKCVINGTLSMDLKAPLRSDAMEAAILNSGASSSWLQKISTLTGGKGGDGGANADANRGLGGLGHRFGGGFGGGAMGQQINVNTGDVSRFKGGDSEPRPPVGITWPYPGGTGVGSYGTGGGGGRSDGLYGKGGDAPGGSGAYYASSKYDGQAGNAYGGGLVLLAVGGELTIGPSGLITSNGGNGGSTSYTGAYTGGGAGGGIIALLTRNPINLSGNLTANGGKAGSTGLNGVDGSVGTIYVARMTNGGTVTPWADAA